MRETEEYSVVRQVVISIGLLVTVVAILAGNMPDSGLKATLDVVAQPFRNATGLYQGWQVFAEPRTVSAYVEGRVDCSDGSSAEYAIPSRPGLEAYADYRWQKYEEMIRVDDGNQWWPAYAQYLANRARSDGRDPVRVTLLRRWADSMPPGPGPERGPWHEFPMYVMALR
jgi:hypothetical protein